MPSDILEVVAAWLEGLPRGLREHVERVVKISDGLAVAHQVERDRAELCARSHDLCRAMTGKELLSRARELGLPVHPVEERLPLLLHGPVAAELLRQEGLEDKEVYQGIYYHSTGCAGMSPVAKVVFLADKLDPHKQRRYPYLEELSVTARGSLDAAVLMFLDREMVRFVEGGQLIHPASVEARNELLGRG